MAVCRSAADEDDSALGMFLTRSFAVLVEMIDAVEVRIDLCHSP